MVGCMNACFREFLHPRPGANGWTRDAQFLLLQPIHQEEEERSSEKDDCVRVEEVDMQNRHAVRRVNRLVHTLSPVESGIILLRTALTLFGDVLGQFCRRFSLRINLLQNYPNDLTASHGSIETAV